MKHLLLILLLLIGLTSCMPVEPTETQKYTIDDCILLELSVRESEISFRKKLAIVPLKMKEHQYLFVVNVNETSQFSIVHDPDCSKCKTSIKTEDNLFDYLHY